MTEFTYDNDIFSDIFKDIHGFRPRTHEFWYASSARKQEIWDSLLIEHDEYYKAEVIRETEAVEAFENRVVETIQMGASDRESAIRWILQAEELDSLDDPSYICYLLRIPYEMAGNFASINK